MSQEKHQAPAGAVAENPPAPKVAHHAPELAPVEAEELVIDRMGHTTPVRALGVNPPPQDALPEAAARIRALRAQALEILPLCEGLSREDGYAVRHQIDLLADVLVMGDRLAREAS